MSQVHNLRYIGEIRAVVADGKQIAFVTEHVENQPTSLYLIDGEANKLSQIELPCGGVSLSNIGGTFWIGGTDGNLYTVASGGKSAKKLTTKLPAAATKSVMLSKDRVGLLTNESVTIVNAKGKITQALELGEVVTAIGASPDGDWFAVGTNKGTVTVFQSEEQDEFVVSESAAMHNAAVTAIQFEPEELRFLSAGADRKLMLTHARGSLEPEDRGRANNHDDNITAIILANEFRFITGSKDKSCKSWALTDKTKPATLSEGVIAVVDLAMAEIHKRPNLVIACHDQSLRLCLIDEDGRFGTQTVRYNDGYVRAAQLLESKELSDRGAALQELAEYADQKSVEMISQRAASESDHKLRLTAVKLLTKSEHPNLDSLLESHLHHADAPVRLAVFAALEPRQAEDTIPLYEKTLATNKSDPGVLAIKGLEKIAGDEKQAVSYRNKSQQVLTQALGNDVLEIQQAAMFALERIFDKSSAQASVLGLNSSSRNAQVMGLVRLSQRGLLKDESTLAALRKAIEAREPETRQTAMLILLMTRPKLLEAVRSRDKDIHRLVYELETTSYVDPTKKKKSESTKAKAADSKLPKTKKSAVKLSPDDYQPLLLAISSRRVDTCLLGARCLSLLADSRAFAILMQLSSEEEASVRVQVCRSLGDLTDARALERLCMMLDDADVSVRDAAYSALEDICHGHESLESTTAPENGLSSNFPDIRLRALQSLVKLVRKSKSRKESPAVSLLKRALSDTDSAVRSEAFKVILNSQVGGGGEATLRIVLTSIHADVRREALTELMADEKQDWAQSLMLEMLNDPDPAIRKDAFEFQVKKHESDSADDKIEWLHAAIKSSHADTREAACQRLIENRTPEAQEILKTAIEDESRKIRLLALRSLIDAGANDVLVLALDSQYIEVQLAAANALAKQGDLRSRDVLLNLVNQPWPEEEHARSVQAELVQSALEALGELADPTTLDAILKLTRHENIEVARSAAKSLNWIVSEDSLESVRPLLQHDDEQMQAAAAMAMALAGDPIAQDFVFSKSDQSSSSQLKVAVAAGNRLRSDRSTGNAMVSTLVRAMDGKQAIANAAFFVMAASDWLQPGESDRLIACLGVRNPRIRLLTAQGLQAIHDESQFAEFMNFVVNDRGEDKPWTIPDDTIELVAKVICFAEPKVAVRASLNLLLLKQDKQSSWDQSWELLKRRFEKAVQAVGKTKVTKESKKRLSKKDSDSLDQLIFGTYVGLAREQGGSHHRRGNAYFGRTVFQIRCAAIRRLRDLALTKKEFLEPAISVITHTCGDPGIEVRAAAFGALQELGVEDSARAQIGIDSGHIDLGKLGLDLLGTGVSAKDRQAMFKETILSRVDFIAIEAADRLKEEIGATKVSKICFDSPNPQLPVRAVCWLGQDYDSQPAAVKRLRELAKNSSDPIRSRAIQVLVNHKDEQVFELVCSHFEAETDQDEQSAYFKWLQNIGDARTPEFLLKLLADPKFETDVPRLLKLIASFRDTSNVPALLKQFESSDNKPALVAAITMISGFDQTIEDENDLLPNRDWMKGQHPRDGKVLASLLEVVLDHGPSKELTRLIRQARWCETAEVDSPLTRLLDHPDEEIRRAAARAYAFRVEKRNAKPDSLVATLEHRDPITQFWAAEGLAKTGDDAGFQVLMTAADLMDDLWFRQRAVLALGYLADERTLDKLLQFVTEEGHALQMVAAEAIGHLGKTEKRTRIVEILKGFVPREGTIAQRAIVGLRWLDDPEAWQVIRERVEKQPFNDCRREAIQQLGYNSDPETHDLLLDQLASTPNDLEIALQAARGSFGEDSLKPDSAYLQGRSADVTSLTDLDRICVDRICADADTATIFEVVGNSSPEVQRILNRHLLLMSPLPVKEAVKALSDVSPEVVQVAARIVGKAGDKKNAKAIQSTLSQWLERFSEHHDNLQRLCQEPDEKFDALTDVVGKLIWAAGRVGGLEKELLDIAISHGNQNGWTRVRRMALLELRSGKITAAMNKKLEILVADFDADVRDLAAEIVLLRSSEDVAASLTDNLLADRIAARHLVYAAKQSGSTHAAVDEASQSMHYHARVLNYQIEAQNVKVLADVVKNNDLAEKTRLGAIEGLARMGDIAAEKQLVAIGKDKNLEDPLRKSAWRGLRRSKRSRTKTESGGKR